jgi:transcriptional regulator GlxA family with amidase domain
VLYVEQGNVVTSAGGAAALDLYLHLVRRDLGEAEATRIARRMILAPHRSGRQTQILQRPVPPTGGPTIAAIAEWALRHLDRRPTVPQLARLAGMSQRMLARRWVAEMGTSPQRWLAEQRLLETRRLLETTDLPVATIAHRSGVGTAGHLRALFSRETATTPSAYRAAHRANLSGQRRGLRRMPGVIGPPDDSAPRAPRCTSGVRSVFNVANAPT